MFCIKGGHKMNIEEIKNLIKQPEYDFLKTNEHLGNHICLLTLGGSHAYGTNVEGSDVDIRGIASLKPENILGTTPFEQFVESNTDTTVYGLTKIFQLFLNVNPNTIEILGCKPEHYLFTDEIGNLILQNKHLFLSKKCIGSFAGYAGAQLSRLENYVCREKLAQPQQEEHIKASIENAMRHWDEKYAKFENGSINLFIDKAVNPDMETEMFVDVNLKHYPLRDYRSLWSEMNEIVKTYKNLGKRNSNAVEHKKLNKHICHLFRLHLMCIDILEKEEINTYREKDHDYLMAIRDGYYMNDDGTIKPELYKELDLLKSKMKDLEKTTKLPEKPYYKDAENLLIKLNKMSLDMADCKKTNIGFLHKYGK